MKKIIFALIIPVGCFGQSITNQSSGVKYPKNITPYAIIEQKTGDTLVWYWNRDEIKSYVNSQGGSTSLTNTYVGVGQSDNTIGGSNAVVYDPSNNGFSVTNMVNSYYHTLGAHHDSAGIIWTTTNDGTIVSALGRANWYDSGNDSLSGGFFLFDLRTNLPIRFTVGDTVKSEITVSGRSTSGTMAYTSDFFDGSNNLYTAAEKTLKVTSGGVNPTTGIFTLVNGQATINTTAVNTGDQIVVSGITASGTLGTYFQTSIVDGTSFTISSYITVGGVATLNTLDSSTLIYTIIKH